MEEKKTVKEARMLRRMEGMEDRVGRDKERDEESEVVHGDESEKLRKDNE